MTVYPKAFETEVYAEDGYIYIIQRQEDRSDDVVQLNKDQAAWLLIELEAAIKELN